MNSERTEYLQPNHYNVKLNSSTLQKIQFTSVETNNISDKRNDLVILSTMGNYREVSGLCLSSLKGWILNHLNMVM